MLLNPAIKSIKQKAVPILKRHGVKSAAIFGSFAHGTARKSSDVDLLVSVKPSGLFAFIGLQHDLERSLGRKVDLATKKALHPLLRKKILEEQIVIYEKKS